MSFDDYRTSGSQTNVLTIGYATNTDSGNYQVIVSNARARPKHNRCDYRHECDLGCAPFTAAGTGCGLQGRHLLSWAQSVGINLQPWWH